MNSCKLRVERRGDEFLIVIPAEIVEAWGLKEGSVVEVRPIVSDEESLDSQISFIKGLIGIWRDEEERLCAVTAEPGTSQEVKRGADQRLVGIRKMIEEHQEELARLKAAR
jgi:bifunctional DNA-binding transcriptional regulator/antitoxin component of YhaV-PrlF toxin-antitoxin module